MFSLLSNGVVLVVWRDAGVEICSKNVEISAVRKWDHQHIDMWDDQQWNVGNQQKKYVIITTTEWHGNAK